jgi:large conductance mechanosensitive channel
MLKGFRDFITRGNVVDLAVAVVIGGAFLAVVTAFTEGILTPLLGLLGMPDLTEWTIVTPGGAVIRYGVFLNALVNFLLVAAALYFFVVRPLNALEARRQAGELANPTTKICPECASEIPLAARRCPNCTQPQPLDAAQVG